MTGNYNKYTNQRFIKLKLWFIHRYEYVKCYGIITEGMVISAGDFGEIKEEFMKLKALDVDPEGWDGLCFQK